MVWDVSGCWEVIVAVTGRTTIDRGTMGKEIIRPLINNTCDKAVCIVSQPYTSSIFATDKNMVNDVYRMTRTLIVFSLTRVKAKYLVAYMMFLELVG